jgi:hypothetical protein
MDGIEYCKIMKIQNIENSTIPRLPTLILDIRCFGSQFHGTTIDYQTEAIKTPKLE